MFKTDLEGEHRARKETGKYVKAATTAINPYREEIHEMELELKEDRKKNEYIRKEKSKLLH